MPRTRPAVFCQPTQFTCKIDGNWNLPSFRLCCIADKFHYANRWLIGTRQLLEPDFLNWSHWPACVLHAYTQHSYVRSDHEFHSTQHICALAMPCMLSLNYYRSEITRTPQSLVILIIIVAVIINSGLFFSLPLLYNFHVVKFALPLQPRVEYQLVISLSVSYFALVSRHLRSKVVSVVSNGRLSLVHLTWSSSI